MKTRPATSGPFRERLYYTADEIEHLTEEDLQKHGLLPSAPSPINIDLYVEQRFLVPRYDDLRPTLLGYTEFGPSGPVDIVLNQELASDRSLLARRRMRTTVAHESGHALLHAILYLSTGQTSLLNEAETEPPRILCKDQDLSTGYNGRWWEYQANLAMGSLLLPKSLTLTALEPYLTRTGLGIRTLDPHNVRRAGRTLTDIFDVSQTVARIRIEHLFKIKVP